MNTRQLQYVITLAEEKSFSEAASKLMISQPSLSQYIQKLEKEIGNELFERTVPLKLTYAGEAYLELAKKIVELESEMDEKMADIHGGRKGRIRIGVGFYSSISFLPRIVSSYLEKFPEVEISVTEDIEQNLKARADEGALDIIFSTSRFDDKAYQCISLFREDFLIAVPRKMSFGVSGHGNGIEDIQTIESSQLAHTPMVMIESNTYIREVAESVFKKKKIKPDVRVTCISVRAAYGMTKVGVGATIIPYTSYRMDYCNTVDYYRIKDLDYQRMFGLYYSRNRILPAFMKSFVDECVNYVKENYPNC